MSFSGAASPAASTTLVLALLLPGAAVAEDDHPYRTQALAGAYHYDTTLPKVEPVVEKPAEAPEPAGRPRKRVPNPAERIPEAGPPPVSAPVGSATLGANGTLMLPKMVVPGAKQKLPPPLPLVYVRHPVKNVGKGHAFETPAGRRARLINKYYTASDQRVAKLLGNSLAASAESNEAAEELNHLAYLIELSLAAGSETPEEQKAIRDEYYKVLYTPPR